jgi:hypothetical protein
MHVVTSGALRGNQPELTLRGWAAKDGSMNTPFAVTQSAQVPFQVLSLLIVYSPAGLSGNWTV